MQDRSTPRPDKGVETANRKTVRITEHQLQILKHMYRFRFVSSDQLRQAFRQQQLLSVQRKLDVMLRRGYIGRHYTQYDAIHGYPAAYYLLPAGIDVLLQHAAELHPQVQHSICKDAQAPHRLQRHYLTIGDITCDLKRLYDDRLQLLTQSDMKPHSYFPDMLPDAYVTLGAKATILDFFLVLCDDGTELPKLWQRIRNYIVHAKRNEWEKATGAELSGLLVIAANPNLQRHALQGISRELHRTHMRDFVVLVATKTRLAQAATNRLTIWHRADDNTLTRLEDIITI